MHVNKQDLKGRNNNMKKYLFIILALLLYSCASNYHPRSTFTDDPEVRKAIETYEENHKDDWKGYKGTRRGSIAETEKLKQDGYDPEQYRSSHGY